MRRFRLLALALAAAAGPAAAQLAATAPAAAPEQVARAALIEGWRQPDGTHMAAIEIRLAPGWHTYWRIPGDAGIPPQFDWSGSGNLASVAYEWPRPEVIESYGLTSIGYRDDLVLPVVLSPQRPGEPIAAELALFYGVCLDICLPAEARLSARLAPDGPPVGRAPIEAALADRPLAPAAAGVRRATCGLAQRAEGPVLTAEVTFASEPGPGQVAVIESSRPELWIGLPESRTDGRRLIAEAALASGAPAPLDRHGLRLTVLDARRAVDIRGCDAPATPPAR